MPIEPAIADITARLRQNKFPNEQAISQGIVLRTLQELGWITSDSLAAALAQTKSSRTLPRILPSPRLA